MGQGPSLANDAIGMLEIDFSCWNYGKFKGEKHACFCFSCCDSCIQGILYPKGPEFEALEQSGKLLPLIQEAELIVANAPKRSCCCFQLMDINNMKAELDSKWVAKANETFATYGLHVQTFAYRTGKDSNIPHVSVQFFKNLEAATSAADTTDHKNPITIER